MFFFFVRYLISRGYGHPQDRDSGSDDDMSDGDGDDMLASTSGGAGGSRGGGPGATNDPSAHRLEFYIGDGLLPYDMTVYQAVQQFGAPSASLGGAGAGGGFDVSDSDSDSRSAMASAASNSIYGSPGVWAKIHTIYYRPASERSAANDGGGVASTGASAESSKSKSDGGKKGKGSSKQSKRKAPDELWSDGLVPERPSPLEPFLSAELPRLRAACPGETGDPSLEVLCLLRCLHALNRYWGSIYPSSSAYCGPLVHPGEFVNTKLTAKVNRQLQDPIIIMTSNLPGWLREVAMACPFLFPFETRQLLFYVTSFDRDRALLRYYSEKSSA